MKKVFFIVFALFVFCLPIFGQRCQAITKKGTQCKRNAQSESVYCWQHQKTTVKESKSESTSTYNGKTVYTGPRGGKYYINKNGKKTYIRRKK